MLHIRLTLCLLLSTCLGCSAPMAAEQPVKAKQWCIVNEEKLAELSGLAPYRGGGEETLFWAHNDGAANKLFLLDSAGDTRATLDIDGIDPVDCEDLCSFQIGKERFLLLADTGDNDLRRKSAKLYLIMEPSLSELEASSSKKKKNKEKPPHTRVKPVAIYEFTYPDGPRNCEAIGVDVGLQQILLLSKEKNQTCNAYLLPLLIDSQGILGEQPLQPQKANDVAVFAAPAITSLAVDPNGGRLVLLGRNELYEVKQPKNPAAEYSKGFGRILLGNKTKLEKPKQKQGEAVCFSPDGKKLYLASEGKNQPIWELELGE